MIFNKLIIFLNNYVTTSKDDYINEGSIILEKIFNIVLIL